MDTIGLKSQNAASTGDSGSAGGAAKSATAAHSRPSRKAGRNATFKTLQNVTPNARRSVTVDVLEVRSGAGESFSNVGYLRRGDLVTVYEIQSATGEACRQWARIGAEQWTCYDFLEVIP